MSPPPPDQDPGLEELQRASRGRALERSARDALEDHFGQDLSGVRVHTDAAAATAARARGAKAFAAGEHIYFGEGTYAPETADGLGLLGHETAHVVQGYRGELSGVAHAPRGGGASLGATRRIEAFAEEHERRLAGRARQGRSRIRSVRLSGELRGGPRVNEVVAQAVRLAERRLDQADGGRLIELGPLRVVAELDGDRPDAPGAIERLAARIVEAALEAARLQGGLERRRPLPSDPQAALLKEDLRLDLDRARASAKTGEERLPHAVFTPLLEALRADDLLGRMSGPLTPEVATVPVVDRVLTIVDAAVEAHPGIEYQVLPQKPKAQDPQFPHRAFLLRFDAQTTAGGTETMWIQIERTVGDARRCAACGGTGAISGPHNLISRSAAKQAILAAVQDAIRSGALPPDSDTGTCLAPLYTRADSTAKDAPLATRGEFQRQCESCEDLQKTAGVYARRGQRERDPGASPALEGDQWRDLAGPELERIVARRIAGFVDDLWREIPKIPEFAPLVASAPGRAAFTETLRRNLEAAARSR